MKTDQFKQLALTFAALVPWVAEAQLVQEISGQAAQDLELVVPLYKSRVLTSSVRIDRVSVGNPDVADILVLRARELYVLGKDLGTTNVLLWNDNDQLIGSVAVEVTHDLDGSEAQAVRAVPDRADRRVRRAALDRAVGLRLERRGHGRGSATRTTAISRKSARPSRDQHSSSNQAAARGSHRSARSST